MEAMPLTSTAFKGLVSTESIEDSLSMLEAQMQGLQPGTPEYEFDQLHLDLEQRELQIQKENPQLNPLTLDGSNALAKLEQNDPVYQSILAGIQNMQKEYPTESTKWGIPMSMAGDILIPIY